jgi:amidase
VIGQPRRRFLRGAAAALAGAWFDRSWAGLTREPAFAPASEVAARLRRGEFSAVELCESMLQRNARFGALLNAVIDFNSRAVDDARRADQALARGAGGALCGVPILLKDNIATAGLRTTAGLRQLDNNMPQLDAVVTARLRAAGAIILGKSSLPPLAGDLQTHNELIGTTNNPWDLNRTAGGSSGGGAAALAAGLAYLDVGNDLGGSIRTPAHFCGVYGLKPSFGLVPGAGLINTRSGVHARAYSEMWVCGPLARDASDLAVGLTILAGADGSAESAWQPRLPPPRHSSLRAYRFGCIPDDALCPLAADVAEAYSAALDRLRQAGGHITAGWPAGVDPQRDFETYYLLASAEFSRTASREEINWLKEQDDAYGRWRHRALTASHRDWLDWLERRGLAQARWDAYLREFDAFLLPANFCSAFAHDLSQPMMGRRILTERGPRPYFDLLRWVSIASLTGCPAVVLPCGLTRAGLPSGLQILGAYLDDLTVIDAAARCAEVLGGFQAPPWFAGAA